MLNIGIIGAGSISDKHLTAYAANTECRVKAIADLNIETAKKKAEEYKIEDVYSDYHDILNDKEIDAVSIVTPTFTHKNLVIEALNAGKHVLCEKPPALNAAETRELKAAAEKSNKCLMFGFIARFGAEAKYVKEYIDAGKMGKILYAEAARVSRASARGGRFVSKEKAGGGILLDGNIHEIDELLYVMGYPKPKAVLALTSDMNSDLPQRLGTKGWTSADKNAYKADVEVFASALVTFENGACLSIKASTVLNTVDVGVYMSISGEKAGMKMERFVPGKELRMLEITDDNQMVESTPELNVANKWPLEIGHFVDCCQGKAECITKIDEAIRLMEIIDAIYKSAETGLPVIF